MTALRFYQDDGDHELYDLQYYHSIVPIVMRCDVSYLIPFCTHYEATGETIDDVVIEYFEGGELTLDSTAMFSVVTDDEWDWIIYEEGEVQSGAAPLDTGLARIVIELSGGTTLYSDFFEICELETESDTRIYYEDYFNIWFSARYDITGSYRIIYQEGYENHHAFNTVPLMADNNLEVDGETDESQYEYVNYQSRKKIYQVEVLGGESLFDMLAILPLHEYVYVRWPGVDLTQVRNVEFEYEWVDDFLCRMTLKWSVENMKKGGCDTDFTLT